MSSGGQGAGTGETGETPPVPVKSASASKGRGKDNAASSSARNENVLPLSKEGGGGGSPRRGNNNGSPRGKSKSKSPRKNKGSVSPKQRARASPGLSPGSAIAEHNFDFSNGSPRAAKEASAASAASGRGVPGTITGQSILGKDPSTTPLSPEMTTSPQISTSFVGASANKASTPAAPKTVRVNANPKSDAADGKNTLQPPKPTSATKTPTNAPFSLRDSLRIAAQEITQLRGVLAKNNIVVPRSRLVANDVKALLSSGEDVVLPAVKAKMDAEAARAKTIQAEGGEVKRECTDKSTATDKDLTKDRGGRKDKENVDKSNKIQKGESSSKSLKVVDAKTEQAFLREQARLEHELSMVKGILLMQNLKINASVTHDSTAVERSKGMMREINISGDANTLNYLMNVKQKLGLLRAQHELLRSDMLCLANEMNTARQWVEKCFAEAVDLQRDAVHGLQARLERLAKLLP